MYDAKKFEHDKNMWYNMSRFTKKRREIWKLSRL